MKPLTGLLLAGGQSRRMGRPKAFLDLNGQPLCSYPLKLLRRYCQETMIVSPDPEPFQRFGVPVCSGEDSGLGPIGGLIEGLSRSTREWSLVLACDMPCVRPQLLDALLKVDPHNCKAIVPGLPETDGLFAQPLCALYHTDFLEALKNTLARGELSLQAALSSKGARVISALELDPGDPGFQSFLNANTPDDLALIHTLITQSINI